MKGRYYNGLFYSYITSIIAYYLTIILKYDIFNLSIDL